jgi:Flp pilus assembly protein TadB
LRRRKRKRRKRRRKKRKRRKRKKRRKKRRRKRRRRKNKSLHCTDSESPLLPSNRCYFPSSLSLSHTVANLSISLLLLHQLLSLLAYMIIRDTFLAASTTGPPSSSSELCS